VHRRRSQTDISSLFQLIVTFPVSVEWRILLPKPARVEEKSLLADRAPLILLLFEGDTKGGLLVYRAC
jgi:hypothetical protein